MGVVGGVFLRAFKRTLDEDNGAFTVMVVGQNKVTLQTVNKNYLEELQKPGLDEDLAADLGLNGLVVPSRMPTPTSDCYFTVEKVAGNTVRFRTINGKYLSSKRDDEYMRAVLAEPNANCDFTVVKHGSACQDKLLHIDFDEKPLETITSPEIVFSQKFRNNSTANQLHKFEFKTSVTESKTFSWNHHFSMSVSTSFSTGVPFLANGEVKMSAEVGFGAGGENTNAETETITVIDFYCYHDWSSWNVGCPTLRSPL